MHAIKSIFVVVFALGAATASAQTPAPDQGPGVDVAPLVADAHDTDLRAHALVIGSNPGGDGQDTLRYAERDAARVADVLRELGGVDSDRITLITRPTPAAIIAALARAERLLAADAASGYRTLLFFYYSGHARATALNLGPDELPLATLREHIVALPATVRVVILDACQSGAFSRVKGAEPAADFSFNSVRRLDAAGLAVMASSTSTELSQESESLQSSYFTHNLLVALRGAGDTSGDGRVSLDEAYRYAYHTTLASTAKTAVGRQHVTLETDLKGKGEVPLTYPARADAHLMLAADLASRVLIQRRPGDAVVAEVDKAAGSAVRLALPHGAYRVLLRQGDGMLQCDVSLRTGQTTWIRPTQCESVAIERTLAKGLDAPALGERWAIELSAGLLRRVEDSYDARLGDFGFHDQLFWIRQLRAGAAYRATRHISAVGELGALSPGEYARDIDVDDGADATQRFTWRTVAIGAYLRAVLPLGAGGVAIFAQAGGGVARAATTFADPRMGEDDEVFYGYHLGAAGGMIIMPWERFGFTARADYSHAPVLENLIGDVHDAGGISASLGVRAAF